MSKLFGIQARNNHTWYHGKNTIAAHHIIDSASVSDNPTKWKKYFDLCDYDINHYNNGIFLPMKIIAACQLKVALHSSNHGAGSAGPNLNYPAGVKDQLSKIEKNIAKNLYCNNPRGLQRALNVRSKKILRFIDKFTWTITADGFDYKDSPNAIGCGNLTNNSIPSKLTLTADISSRCSRFNDTIVPFTRDHEILHTGTNPTQLAKIARSRYITKTGNLEVGT